MIVSKSKNLSVELERSVCEYHLTSVVIDDEENLRYTTYGICVLNPYGDVIKQFADVSTDKKLIQQIVDDCNNHQASAIHLKDIILDRIG